MGLFRNWRCCCIPEAYWRILVLSLHFTMWPKGTRETRYSRFPGQCTATCTASSAHMPLAGLMLWVLCRYVVSASGLHCRNKVSRPPRPPGARQPTNSCHLWASLPFRASRWCVRRWPSAGTTTQRPVSRPSVWRSASASWSTWTDSRGGAAPRRRFPKMARWALPNSSSRAGWPESKEVTPVAKEQRQQEAAPNPMDAFWNTRAHSPPCRLWDWAATTVTGSGWHEAFYAFDVVIG